MRKNQKIKVVEFVHVGDQLVNVEGLTPEQYQRFAQKLTCEWLNGLFHGRAVFSVPEIAPHPALRDDTTAGS